MKRQLIFCPAISPSSFVLLFEKGESGQSWSIRDYSDPNCIATRYAKDVAFDLSTIKLRTIEFIAAPALPTNDLRAWHQLILNLNAQFGITPAGPISRDIIEPPSTIKPAQPEFTYPLLRSDLLQSLPKARKQQDMKRIFTSANSEDWVTWNTFSLLELTSPRIWWGHLVSLAQEANFRRVS